MSKIGHIHMWRERERERERDLPSWILAGEESDAMAMERERERFGGNTKGFVEGLGVKCEVECFDLAGNGWVFPARIAWPSVLLMG